MKYGKWINKTAFLNGFIKEELYTMQLEGFVDPKGANKVCKLQRSIGVDYDESFSLVSMLKSI